MVEDMLSRMDTDMANLKVDTKLGVLQDQSVGWLWDAFNALNNKDFVQKVHYSPIASLSH